MMMRSCKNIKLCVMRCIEFAASFLFVVRIYSDISMKY